MSESPFSQFAAACAEQPPRGFIVLGSGLGILSERVEEVAAVSFADIPGLPSAQVAGHRGRFVLGRWAARVVLVSEGRVHYYEGHDWDVVVRPVEVAASLGVRWVLLTNAAGGIRDDLVSGSLMPLRDQMEWNLPEPWRRPAQPTPYDLAMLEVVVEAGAAMGLDLRPGVYAAVSGPNYETAAEIKALRASGADAVGMSTTREARRAAELGLKVAAVSLITNRAAGLAAGKLSHEEVLAAGQAAAGRLAEVIGRMVERQAE